MNNKFNLTRFCNLIKLQFVFEWRMILVGAVGLVGVVSVIYFLCNLDNIFSVLTNSNGESGISNGSVLIARFSLLFIGMFLYVYIISRSFKQYFKAGVGASAIMLPATQLEKFLAVAFKLIVAPIAIGATLMLTDFVWIEGLKLSHAQSYLDPSITENIFVLFGKAVSGLWHEDVLLSSVTLILLEVMLYFLCSVLFRRHTLLFSIIAVSMAHFVLFTSAGLIFMSSFPELSNMSEGYYGSSQLVLNLINVFQLLQFVVLVYITWYRFTRIQISK